LALFSPGPAACNRHPLAAARRCGGSSIRLWAASHRRIGRPGFRMAGQGTSCRFWPRPVPGLGYAIVFLLPSEIAPRRTAVAPAE